MGGLVYLAYNSGALAPFGISAPPASTNQSPGGLQPNVSVAAPPMVATVGNPIPAPLAVSPTPVTGINTIGILATSGAGIASAAVSAPSSFAALGLTGAAAGAAVAGIGAVVAIGAALLAAHEARKKQATSENAAVNVGVQGFDSDLKTVNTAYNNRSLDAQDAMKLVQQVFSQYWELVTPVIQPGRNGCNGGSSCPPWPAKGSGCSGSIGAACCVGCYDLAGAPTPFAFTAAQGGNGSPMYYGIGGTLAVLAQGGGTVLYQAVVGSSYGGKNRAAYTLSWKQVAAA